MILLQNRRREACRHQVNLDFCSRQVLGKEDFKSIEGIIYRYDHLKQNIAHIEYMDYRTYRSKMANKFDHSIWITLTVKTKFLWENGRSYVWKHLGQNEWKKADGSKLTMNGNHAKT